ncbi:PREDICTED: uncharacterized protein LOC104589777 isoform X2 [Nelumbo nucifera]|uniref:Uncharacterized protein LOC104589777 isoform X2 n=1 Tax=Nelumbo nucifera TaxID=4432 RepID=A0A1U7ZET5_NELNU|nr:PREDICTED: uncharacterized protein LOC104589777 isoform X2 [Nelumbo nucifera]
MNPSPMTRRLMDNPETSPSSNGISVLEKLDEKTTQLMPSKRTILQQLQGSADLHSQATTYARLAESRALKAKMKKAQGYCQIARVGMLQRFKTLSDAVKASC